MILLTPLHGRFRPFLRVAHCRQIVAEARLIFLDSSAGSSILDDSCNPCHPRQGGWCVVKEPFSAFVIEVRQQPVGKTPARPARRRAVPGRMLVCAVRSGRDGLVDGRQVEASQEDARRCVPNRMRSNNAGRAGAGDCSARTETRATNHPAFGGPVTAPPPTGAGPEPRRGRPGPDPDPLPRRRSGERIRNQRN